jgi:hypothetical protein
MGKPISRWTGINWASETFAKQKEAIAASDNRRAANERARVTGGDARTHVIENPDGTFTHRYHL